LEGDSEMTYWCHTRHIHSSPNSWQQIFGGLYLGSTTTNIRTAHLWIVDFNNLTDSLSMLSDGETTYNNHIYANYTSHGSSIRSNRTSRGSMYLRTIGDSPLGDLLINNNDPKMRGRTWVTNDVWVQVLRMQAYKILDGQPSQCDPFIGKTRTFGLQLFDRWNRPSHIFYHTMRFQPAGMIYTDDVNVLTTNDQSGEIIMRASINYTNPNRYNLTEVYLV